MQDKASMIATTLGTRRTKSTFTQASKAQMKASGEYPANYKASESNRALLRRAVHIESSPKIRNRQNREKKNATPIVSITRPVNNDQRCYVNSLLQNIFACKPLYAAIMDTAEAGSVPMTMLRDIIARIEYHTENNPHEWCNLTEIKALIETFTTTDSHVQHCPLELLEWILTSQVLPNTAILNDVFTLHRTTEHIYCKGCNTTISAEVNEAINFHCTVRHPSNACTLQQCLDTR
jgi:hypothetical protein